MLRLTPGQWSWMSLATIAIALCAHFAVQDISVLRRAGVWFVDVGHASFRPTVAAPRDDLVLVAITPESLADLPHRYTLDAGWLAALVSRIAAARPRLIALDLPLDGLEPEQERRLVATVKAAGVPVVVGVLPGMSLSAVFTDAGWRQGDIAPMLDESGLWRRLSSGETGPDGVARLGFAPTVLDALSQPWEDLYGSAIDFQRSASGPAGVFRSVPADSAMDSEALRGKIVLIGTELDYRDQFRTPLAAVLGRGGGTLPHVEIQAQSVAQLLDHRARWTLGNTAALLVTFLAAALGFLLQTADVTRWQQAAGTLVVAVIGWLVAGLCVRFLGLDIPVLAPSLAFGTGFVVAQLSVTDNKRRKRRLVAGVFAGIIGPELTQRILGERSDVGLSGTSCDAVVLQCEIAHLDPLADTLPPAELVATVASLQKRLTALALDHDGTVVRHLPGGLAVLFGAPLALPRAGQKALRCAQSMALAAEAAAEGKAPDVAALGVRIALHAGSVITGDFGGGTKPLYDAVGRTMAIAGRLLDLCPVLGVSLLASYDAAARVPGVTFRPIGTFELPDWQGAVEVFVPLSPGESKGAAASYLKGIEELHKGNLEAAHTAFLAALETDPNDGPARFHVMQLEAGEIGKRLPWPLAAGR